MANLEAPRCTQHGCMAYANGSCIAELKKIIRDMLHAYRAGSVEMSSPEIGGEDDIPLHPWHEEWLHNAERAVGN